MEIPFHFKSYSKREGAISSDIELYRSLNLSQIANMTEVLCLRLTSLACFSEMEVTIIDTKVAGLED